MEHSSLCLSLILQSQYIFMNIEKIEKIIILLFSIFSVLIKSDLFQSKHIQSTQWTQLLTQLTKTKSKA